MITALKNYQNLKPVIIYAVAAQFFLQLVHTAFILIFNIYLRKLGFSDSKIADFTSYRFLGILCFAIPLGLYIKNHALKPMFYIAGYGVPASFLFILYGAKYNYLLPLYLFSYLSGVFFSCLQVGMLPFILRNAGKSTEPEAISLFHATFSISMVLCSLSIFLLSKVTIFEIDESVILFCFCLISFLCPFFVSFIKTEEISRGKDGSKWDIYSFDWLRIFEALLPSAIIAIGAGLTIPYINLFFLSIHGLDYGGFSLLNFGTAILVSIAFFYVPSLKRKYGYKVAICLSQFLAIGMLCILASTEFYREYWFAIYIAFACFTLRQPLMNMAGPSSAHLVMNYVGEKNQEITSALHSAVWSGSWFISAKIFKYLRSLELDYCYIFFITAIIYSVGASFFYLLIIKSEKENKKAIVF